ncbi:hypothetical protein TWF481_009703 [Arthrobotrys musiformis]|uniref:Uncharacterized protein n=1 Tax=Arthrobotrys musiformis TaxID=47236 RepID=A0AAV9W4J7_9PEZI
MRYLLILGIINVLIASVSMAPLDPQDRVASSTTNTLQRKDSSTASPNPLSTYLVPEPDKPNESKKIKQAPQATIPPSLVASGEPSGRERAKNIGSNATTRSSSRATRRLENPVPTSFLDSRNELKFKDSPTKPMKLSATTSPTGKAASQVASASNQSSTIIIDKAPLDASVEKFRSKSPPTPGLATEFEARLPSSEATDKRYGNQLGPQFFYQEYPKIKCATPATLLDLPRNHPWPVIIGRGGRAFKRPDFQASILQGKSRDRIRHNIQALISNCVYGCMCDGNDPEAGPRSPSEFGQPPRQHYGCSPNIASRCRAWYLCYCDVQLGQPRPTAVGNPTAGQWQAAIDAIPRYIRNRHSNWEWQHFAEAMGFPEIPFPIGFSGGAGDGGNEAAEEGEELPPEDEVPPGYRLPPGHVLPPPAPLFRPEHPANWFFGYGNEAALEGGELPQEGQLPPTLFGPFDSDWPPRDRFNDGPGGGGFGGFGGPGSGSGSGFFGNGMGGSGASGFFKRASREDEYVPVGPSPSADRETKNSNYTPAPENQSLNPRKTLAGDISNYPNRGTLPPTKTDIFKPVPGVCLDWAEATLVAGVTEILPTSEAKPPKQYKMLIQLCQRNCGCVPDPQDPLELVYDCRAPPPGAKPLLQYCENICFCEREE